MLLVRPLMHFYLSLFRCLGGLALLFFLLPSGARASHMFGADLFYTHVSNHTYTITMVVYADCDLNNNAFNALPYVSPEVVIYRGNTVFQGINLSPVPPTAGTEVTPVCPSQLNNTSCRSASGTVPGIRQYTYSKTVNLGSTHANWRFQFTGFLGANTSAGRSNSLTNIIISTVGSLMGLEATLNNTAGPNSSPRYTTIPTPFFCINKVASYNPGAVDPNGDSLYFALVPGLDQQTGGFVSYMPGLSATNPLHVAANSFSTSSTTGQINFTPNQTQRSLVVSKVTEYRNQVPVGTSMREMTFLVFNNCNNNPPGGIMTSAQGGTISGGTVFTACAGTGNMSFQIPATDLDGDTIDMSVQGLPTGASFPISNNRTRQPVGSFSWNLQQVVPGNYTFYVTYLDYGCPLSSKQTVAYNLHIKPNPQFLYTPLTPATCVAKSQFQVFPWGGTLPYQLEAWQGSTPVHQIPSMGSPQLDSLAPGIYTLVVRDQHGCKADSQILIPLPPRPQALVTPVLPTCDQDSNGKLLVSAQGGLAPYQYALNGGSFQSSGQFGQLKAGTYSIQVKDANQCLGDTVVNLPNPTPLQVDLLHESPLCHMKADGSLEAYPRHGAGPYQFSINGQGFSSQNHWNGLLAGSYQIQVRDTYQCLAQTSFTLVDSLSLHSQTLVTPVACFGDSNGAVLLNAHGTVAPYTYSLGGSPLQAGSYFTGLAAGQYPLRIEDSLGCFLDSLITITEPAPLAMGIQAIPISCFGSDDGEISVSPSGGQSPYLLALDGGPYLPNSGFSGLEPGTFTIHLMDDHGCKLDSLVRIEEPDPLVFGSLTGTNPRCHGGADGQILAAALGGTAPYQYRIGSGSWQTSATLSGLSAGAHILQIQDDRGCQIDRTLHLDDPLPVRVQLDLDHPLCQNLFTGVIDVQASGGQPGYTYALGGGAYQSNPRFHNLGAGLYTLHVRDAYLCQKDTTLRLEDSVLLHFQTQVSPITCFDSAMGVIEVMAPHGGTGPYEYGIGSQPLGALPRFSSLGPGMHRVVIQDQKGCIADTQIQLIAPARIVPQIQHNDIACHGFNNVQIQASATGGTPGYAYALNQGSFQTQTYFQNIPAGTHRVSVRDQWGCIRDTIFQIEEPDPLQIQALQIQDLRCAGDSSGMVEPLVTGGTPPYMYRSDFLAFSPGPRIENLPGGAHRIQVRDAQGCLIDTQVLLAEPPPLELEVQSITHPSCENFEDGEILIQPKGGTPPYAYIHNQGTPGSNPRLRPLGAGSHLIQVRDHHGCLRDTILQLIGYPPIEILSLEWTPPRCAHGEDGHIQLWVDGGNPPYAYQLDQGDWQSNPSFTQARSGSHQLRIRDSENCLEDTLIEIMGPDPISLSLWSTPVSCEAPISTASVGADVRGGTGTYRFHWETPSGPMESRGISSAAPGSYLLKVEDDHQCTATAETEVVYENCCKPFLPNAFTPNGDGLNDRFRILYKGDFQLIEFFIVNRYGQVVFLTRDAEQGWDGRFQGVEQDLGTYFYYLKAHCGRQDPQLLEMKGDFILVR